MSSGLVRRSVAVGVAALSISSVVGGLPQAGAAVAKTIHPGVTVNFGGISCAVGAVMRQRRAVYLAVPASCGGIDLGKTQDGCSEPMTPVGSPVSIEGARHKGTLVYNSFTSMQLRGTRSPAWCYYNDLALIRVNRHDRGLVSPTIPGTGAPARVLSTLPKDGTALRIGTNTATAGSTFERGWSVDATSQTAMFKTADAGLPVTAGNDLAGMLIVLPKGPLGAVPVLQAPAEVYNLSRAITRLHETPGFRDVSLVRAGQRV